VYHLNSPNFYNEFYVYLFNSAKTHKNYNFKILYISVLLIERKLKLDININDIIIYYQIIYSNKDGNDV
jgi:hypothetical protein